MNHEKVIVINDMDGHTTVLQWSKENLRKVLEAFITEDSNLIDDLLDYADPIEFLSDDPGTAAIESYLLAYVDNVNGRNGPCHILEPIDWPFGKSNPFA